MTDDMRPARGRLSKTRAIPDQLRSCVDADTHALTRRGWLRYDALRIGDELRTINLNTCRSEWRPIERVHIHEGPHIIRRLDARSHSSVTSLGHKWVTRDHDTGVLRIRHTADLRTNDRVIRAVQPADTPLVATYSDQIVELLGWFWTEGHIRQDGAVQIFQSWRVNEEKCLRIRAAMIGAFGDPARSMSNGRQRIPRWLERKPTKRGLVEWYLNATLAKTLTDLAPARVVRPDVIASMTTSQLRLFIETSVDADGYRRRNGIDRFIAQKKLEQVEAAEMACALLGVPTTRYVQHDRHRGTECWQLRMGSQCEIRPVASALRKDNASSVDSIESSSAVGWCPEVANGTWLARRRGTVYYTGDSEGSGQLVLPLMSLGMAS